MVAFRPWNYYLKNRSEMRRVKFVQLLACLIIVNLPARSQTTISLYPLADAEINQNGGGSFAGSSGAFQIYPWTPSFSKRAVIKFNLTPYAGCTINSAWLILMEQSTNTVSRQINVHRITTTWAENSTHWTTPWTASGGDFAASPVGTFTPAWTGSMKQDSVNLTTTVQSFINGTYSNFGWLLKTATEDATQQYWAYYSKEASTVSFRPILRIKYSGCSPLPIELLRFDANPKNNNQVVLTWQTASEKNNDFFTVESSIDGISWLEQQHIKGAGNSTTILNYSTLDENPYEGTSYYRLKQTDYDGQFSYSAVRVINLFSKIPHAIIYPNPTKYQVTITSTVSELRKLRIYNLIGQDVTSLITEIKKEETRIIIDVKNLCPGVYYIKTENTINKLCKE